MATPVITLTLLVDTAGAAVSETPDSATVVRVDPRWYMAKALKEYAQEFNITEAQLATHADGFIYMPLSVVAAVNKRVLTDCDTNALSCTVSLLDLIKDMPATDPHNSPLYECSFTITGSMQREAIPGCMGEHPECPCPDCDEFRHK